MKLSSTKKQSKYVNTLIYGKFGIGKTPLSATAPKPVIIDTDEGTLSIADLDLPVLEVRTFDDLKEAYDKLNSKWGKQFDTIILDSGYELVDIVLQGLKADPEIKDKRQAYMAVAEETKRWIRMFRDLNKHFIMTSLASVTEVDGIEKLRVSFPGKVLPRELPGMFDEVFVLRYADEDEEDEIVLQCKQCSDYDARDRSRKLKKFEKLDMTYIFNKIQNNQKKETNNGKRKK